MKKGTVQFKELLTQCFRTNTGCEQEEEEEEEGTEKADEWRGLSKVINSVCADPIWGGEGRGSTLLNVLYCIGCCRKEFSMRSVSQCGSANLTRKRKSYAVVEVPYDSARVCMLSATRRDRDAPSSRHRVICFTGWPVKRVSFIGKVEDGEGR